LTTIAKLEEHFCMSRTLTMNIALPEGLRHYVAERVESGNYGNTSEYVRELIRKDQQQQSVDALRALLQEGLASGDAKPDTAQELQELRQLARGKRG
jgi:antitoxin ParD1/3/4